MVNLYLANMITRTSQLSQSVIATRSQTKQRSEQHPNQPGLW